VAPSPLLLTFALAGSDIEKKWALLFLRGLFYFLRHSRAFDDTSILSVVLACAAPPTCTPISSQGPAFFLDQSMVMSCITEIVRSFPFN